MPPDPPRGALAFGQSHGLPTTNFLPTALLFIVVYSKTTQHLSSHDYLIVRNSKQHYFYHHLQTNKFQIDDPAIQGIRLSRNAVQILENFKITAYFKSAL